MRNRSAYNYLHISKRIHQCVQLELYYVGEPVLKLIHCDQEYLNEMVERANELFDSLTPSLIMSAIKLLPLLPKDFPKFHDYICYSLKELLIIKMKLVDDECISHFEIEYEKNHTN
ncbi:MAG: hypothetical protein RIR01_2294 [Bacteroidota bacterium]|jgi:hypothetical protein